MDEEIEVKKEKIKKWLKDPYNLTLVGVMFLTLIIQIYYFSMTVNQPLWYDEAEYMSIAKKWAFGTPYIINPQRPILFPFLASLIYKVGFGELPIKFFLELIPAVLVVFFTFLFVKEVYDKKIALITCFITSVSWIHIFYAMRFMTDSLSLLFGILSFLFFWKGWVKKQGDYYLLLVGLFIALSFLSRLTGILYGAVIFLFLLLTFQFKAAKNKYMWSIPFIFLITIVPYLIWSHFYFGNALAFRSGYGEIDYNYLGWHLAKFVYDYPELIFFITFLIGTIITFPIFFVIDKIIFGKDENHYNNFFMILLVVFTLGFFIYFLREGENRWLIMMSIGIFTLSAKGIVWIYDAAKKNIGKTIAFLILILILVSGAYFQLKHVDTIIKMKKDTYSQVKDAALWIKQNSNPNDIVVSASITQNTFYSERETIPFANSIPTIHRHTYYTEEEFMEIIKIKKPKYLIVSVFEPSVIKWSYSFPEKYNNSLSPVQAYFADPENKQLLLIIYQFKNYNFAFDGKENNTAYSNLL